MPSAESQHSGEQEHQMQTMNLDDGPECWAQQPWTGEPASGSHNLADHWPPPSSLSGGAKEERWRGLEPALGVHHSGVKGPALPLPRHEMSPQPSASSVNEDSSEDTLMLATFTEHKAPGQASPAAQTAAPDRTNHPGIFIRKVYEECSGGSSTPSALPLPFLSKPRCISDSP